MNRAIIVCLVAVFGLFGGLAPASQGGTAWAQSAQFYQDRATKAYHKGEFKQAIADYTKALQINPKDAVSYACRGRAYEATSEYDKAIADCTKAVEIMPIIEIYLIRGLVLSGKADRLAMQMGMQMGVEALLGPTDITDNEGLKLRHEFHRINAQAIADYTKALEIDPKSGLACRLRAKAWFRKGDYGKAWEDVRKAQSLGEKVDPKFLENLRQWSELEKQLQASEREK